MRVASLVELRPRFAGQQRVSLCGLAGRFNSTLAPMPFENSSLLSRRDIMKIAQRFNAGFCDEIARSPGGTIEVFYRPSGTRLPFGLNPALKRWAIVGCPSGTNGCPNIRKALTLARIF